jgi:transposase-like protein
VDNFQENRAASRRSGTAFHPQFWRKRHYFNGHLPVFTHPVDDIASFRFFTSQLIANGSASQSQISKAFGVPLVTVKRACKKLRVEGASAFFRPSPPRQGHKLTPELLLQAQALLDEGLEVPAIAERLGILPNTLHKAISHHRLKKKIAPN